MDLRSLSIKMETKQTNQKKQTPTQLQIELNMVFQ